MRAKCNKDMFTVKIWRDELVKAWKSPQAYDELVDDIMNAIKDAQMDYLVKNSYPFIKDAKGGTK